MHGSFGLSVRFFFAALLTLICAPWAVADLNVVEGRVSDESGAPIVGAQVFLEQGLGGSLRATESQADGSYRFDNVLSGFIGVFAHATGHAFGGKSLQVAISGDVHDADIRLGLAGNVSGTIKDHNGKPVPAGRITRVLLIEQNVGIPLTKLAAFDFPEPRSDERGGFSVEHLPRDQNVALKVAHPKYAQEGTSPIEVGNKTARIRLTPGVLILGSVAARGSGAPVSNATLFFRNVHPPKDTVVTRSGGDGAFSLRLRPGAYAFWASGSSYRSPTMQPLTVTGQNATQKVSLQVAAKVKLTGMVLDARTEKPVAGARIILESYGVPADVTHTGPTGEFEFSAAEGESVIRLVAVPGYMAPSQPAVRVILSANAPPEPHKFWLAPIPTYNLEVLDDREQPVAGAVVSVLRPAQFGWHITDSNGAVDIELASLPADGTVIGVVEHPLRDEAALFAITRERSMDAIVQLLPLSAVSGRVASSEGRGVQGAVIESRFTYEGIEDTVVLWRTVSDSNGKFTWHGVVPHVPQLPVALAADRDDTKIESSSESFIALGPEEPITLADIRIENASSEKSMLTRRLKWYDLEQLCGAAPNAAAENNRSAVVVYCNAQQAPYIAESLEQAKIALKNIPINFALVVSADVACPDVSFPIFKGDAPGVASTYLVNREGRVTLETFGLPPIFAIRRMVSEGQ